MSGGTLTESFGCYALPIHDGARWVRFCGPKAVQLRATLQFHSSKRYRRRSLPIYCPAVLGVASHRALVAPEARQ